MSTGGKEQIGKSVLRLLLREVLKDGAVSDAERQVLARVTNLLSIRQEIFDATLQEVRSDLEVDPAAGSLDTMVFFKRIAEQLLSVHAPDAVEPVLEEMAKALKVDPALVKAHAKELTRERAAGPGSLVAKPEEEKWEKWMIRSREGVNYVEINLRHDAVRTESGAMRYMLGNIDMESRMPSVGGFLKAAFTGETVFKPTYRGTGKLVLEPSLFNYFKLVLEEEPMVLDQGAYWASDMSVEVSAYRNKAISALFSGEGWFQTLVEGMGTVIVSTPGPVEIVDLEDDVLVVDGSFAVARSASLGFEVRKSTKSIFGSLTSGEGIVNTISGTGRVYLAPIPNLHVLQRSMLRGAVSAGRK